MTPVLLNSHFSAGMFLALSKNSFQKYLNITKSPFHKTCNLQRERRLHYITFKHSLPALAETKGVFVLLSRSRCGTAFVTSSLRYYHTPRHREKLLQYFTDQRNKSNSVTSHSLSISCLNYTSLLFPRNTFLHVCAYSKLYSFKCPLLPVPSLLVCIPSKFRPIQLLSKIVIQSAVGRQDK